MWTRPQAPTSTGQWWRLPQEKNSSYGAAMWGIVPAVRHQACLCRKLHLFSGKSTETAATRAALFDSQYAPHRLSAMGLRRRSYWGSLQRPQTPQLYLGGPTRLLLKGGEGEETEGRWREEREFVLRTRKKKRKVDGNENPTGKHVFSSPDRQLQFSSCCKQTLNHTNSQLLTIGETCYTA